MRFHVVRRSGQTMIHNCQRRRNLMVLDCGPHLLLPIVIGQQVRGNQKTGANDKRSARLPGVEVRSVKQIQALLRPVARIADTWTHFCNLPAGTVPVGLSAPL
jgi:hypothetical protein